MSSRTPEDTASQGLGRGRVPKVFWGSKESQGRTRFLTEEPSSGLIQMGDWRVSRYTMPRKGKPGRVSQGAGPNTQAMDQRNQRADPQGDRGRASKLRTGELRLLTPGHLMGVILERSEESHVAGEETP